MLSYNFLLDLFLILVSTKILGLVSKKINMPTVVGALLAGIVLGPACLNILHETEFIMHLSELGVIVIMFTAGLEIDINELKRCGKASFLVALCGVLVPIIGGAVLGMVFNTPTNIFNMTDIKVLQNIFIGIILTATSVSITVETLKELGKLNSKVGSTILGAALIDDILGIIALTFITSMASTTSTSVVMIISKMAIFFVLAIVIGIFLSKYLSRWMEHSEKGLRRYTIFAFALCLIFAFVAERFFGVADITGAFIAGVILSNSPKSPYLDKRFNTLGYMLLSPVFFASIGLKVNLGMLDSSLIIFTIALIIVAILTKIVGGAIGAKISKFTNRESMQIGTAMMTRGEVALIVANKGAEAGLMTPAYFGPVVMMVIVCALLSPILLKILFTDKKIV